VVGKEVVHVTASFGLALLAPDAPSRSQWTAPTKRCTPRRPRAETVRVPGSQGCESGYREEVASGREAVAVSSGKHVDLQDRVRETRRCESTSSSAPTALAMGYRHRPRHLLGGKSSGSRETYSRCGPRSETVCCRHCKRPDERPRSWRPHRARSAGRRDRGYRISADPMLSASSPVFTAGDANRSNASAAAEAPDSIGLGLLFSEARFGLEPGSDAPHRGARSPHHPLRYPPARMPAGGAQPPGAAADPAGHRFDRRGDAAKCYSHKLNKGGWQWEFYLGS
jgi:hypothetical protein